MTNERNIATTLKQAKAWLLQERHKVRARQLRDEVEKAFTEHPRSAGETYLEHLWFTLEMSGRFAIMSSTILVHGCFPFLFTRTTSNHIEAAYRVMKTRIPKKRREEIDRECYEPIRLSSSSREARVGIIGGGFSGALVLANLIRSAQGTLTVEWFEPGTPGEGVAYGTQEPMHLLNVRADGMGAFAGKPEHFYEWLQSAAGNAACATFWPGQTIAPDRFVPRSVYAAYLKQIVHEALAEARTKQIVVNIHAATVADIRLHHPDSQQLVISFHEGDAAHEHVVDAAVLATGNLPPRSHEFQIGLAPENSGYVRDVWRAPPGHLFPKRVAELPTDSEIVIVGTGLTMVDTVLTLKANGFRGRIIAISRSGVRPNVHVPGKTYPAWEWVHHPEYAPTTAVSALTRLRQEVRQAEAQGYHWQSVIDSLRPVTQSLWQRLDMIERRKFLSRLSTFWSVHRHRMAQEIDAQLRMLEANGTLRILAGKIYYIGSDKNGVTVAYRPRGTNRVEALSPALVLNCTGSEYDIAMSDHPLLKRLRDRGLITVGLLRAGIEITPQGTAKGKADESLFPVGTLMVGELLECTAVPELREQAHTVARQVLTRVRTLREPRALLN